MTYAALPDRRMPYDDDGSVYALGNLFDGIRSYPTGTQTIHANGFVMGGPGDAGSQTPSSGAPLSDAAVFLFFPEQREISGYYTMGWKNAGAGQDISCHLVEGSTDSTNGLDGTWETAAVGGVPDRASSDVWRSEIKSVSFTGPKKVLRLRFDMTSAYLFEPYLTHIYGEKAAGQTPDDILFLDAAAGDAEFATALDFGDRPLGTTTTHQFKVQNASATHTANTINLQCNDPDYAISTDGVTYVATIVIASLAAGAKSAVMYVRDTTPAPGAALGPRFARIVCTVASYT